MIITTITRGKVQLPPIFWPFLPIDPLAIAINKFHILLLLVTVGKQLEKLDF